MLGLFGNPLTDVNKYFLLNRNKLKEHFKKQLSPEKRVFSNLFLHFLNLDINFVHAETKDDPHSWSILEVSDSKTRG